MDSKIKLFILIFFLSVIALLAQEGWYYQTPHGMRDVQFVASNKIVAVGRGIWLSTNIQSNWKGIYPGYDQEMQPYGYNKWLTAVDFPSSTVGFAVGSSPNVLIVKTDDGGNNWRQVKTNFEWLASELHDVKFIDTQTGFAVGYMNLSGKWSGTILKTTDGGESWTQALQSSVLFRAIDINANHTIWVAGGTHQIAKSTDLGNTWTESNANTGSETFGLTYDIEFINDNDGLLNISDASKIFRTSDGGATWQLIETGLVGSTAKFQYFDDGTVYTVLQDNDGGSAFYKSTDHAESWTQVNYSQDAKISMSFTFLNKDFGVFDGSSDFGSSNTRFHITNDGGASFEEYNPGLDCLYFIPNTTLGWASGYDTHIYKTSDGKLWTVNKMMHSEGYEINSLFKLQFINESKGFAIGSRDGFGYPTDILYTEDGGLNWSSHDFGYVIYGVYFLNETFGWVVGYNGTIYKTLDGGETWGPQTSGTTSTLLNVFFYDEQLGWAVGEGNTLLKTNNGGLLWEKIDMSAFPEYSLNSITSYGGEICYLEGSDYMLKSANSGDSWTAISKPYTNSYFDYQKIIPISEIELYTFYGNGIYHSNDGGGSWKLIKENSHAIYPQTWENIWAASSGILYTENAGVVGIEEVHNGNEIVSEFKLEQNYPNPFNPSTTIEYSLNKESWVSLKVYDILGREVAELVNEFKKNGNYKINFNAKGLSSGIYIYTLKTHNNSISQKMLLLR